MLNVHTLEVPVRLSGERVRDLIINALEGGSGYWAALSGASGGSYEAAIKSVERTAGHGWWFDISIDDGTDPDRPGVEVRKTKRLDPDTAKAGLARMLDRHPRDFADILSGRDDADTADVFLQLALLGEVQFG